MNETVAVSGIWLVARGNDLEVLAEVDGEWRTVIREQSVAEGRLVPVSHCVHPGGIRRSEKTAWLKEPVTSEAP